MLSTPLVTSHRQSKRPHAWWVVVIVVVGGGVVDEDPCLDGRSLPGLLPPFNDLLQVFNPMFYLNQRHLQASKKHPHHSLPLCLSCQHEPKDPWHFLECSHPEHATLFHNLKDQLTQLIQHHCLYPCIFTIVWLGLQAIWTSTPYPEVLQDVPPQLQKPIQTQLHLGWDQLYHGQVSADWATAINSLHPQLAIDGAQVMTSRQKLIWNYILETWKMRNQHLHNHADLLNLPNYRQAVITLYKQCHLLAAAA